ncbi:MAG TPA: hypothetical protein VGB26_04900 [Nitrospiria bacterium]|jgi:hypothetical protein
MIFNKVFGISLCFLILVQGCGDGGSSSTVSGNSVLGCSASASSQAILIAQEGPKAFGNTVGLLKRWVERGRDFLKSQKGVQVANAQGVSAMVTGNVTYEDREYNSAGFTGNRTSNPIRFGQVQVIRVNDGAVLATGASDGGGVYSISFSNDGATGVYVRVLSKTDSGQNVNLEVRDNRTQNALYAVTSTSFDENSVPSSVNIHATVASGGGGPFNILDVLTEASEWVRNLDGTAPPLLKAYWETGTTDGTCFNSALDSIFLLGEATDTDEYDDDIIIHEYAHFLSEKLSRDDSPGGPHTLRDSTQDTRLAWSEGFAHFLSSAVQKKSSQIDTKGGDNGGSTFFEIEGPSLSSLALFSSNEIAVAAVLWDIFDDPMDVSITGSQPEAFDTLTLGGSPIWDVFTQSLPNKSPAKLGTFWEGWFDRGHNELVGMTSIFGDRKIDFFEDIFELNDDNFNPNRKITGSTEFHTFYLSTFGNDVDVVGFDAVGNQFYTVQTENLTNGADTFMEIYCCDSVPSFIAFSDNLNGQTYTFDCGLSCPPNDQTTLSSSRIFMATQTGVHYVRITRSPSVPASAGRFGSYVLRIQ